MMDSDLVLNSIESGHVERLTGCTVLRLTGTHASASANDGKSFAKTSSKRMVAALISRVRSEVATSDRKNVQGRCCMREKSALSR